MNNLDKICKLILATVFFLTFEMRPLMANESYINSDVELQWAICEEKPENFFSKMNVTYENAKLRSISFFDTPELDYLHRGIIFRVIGKTDSFKTTVKVEIPNHSSVRWDWLKNVDHSCEWNYYLAKQQVSCSFDSNGSDIEFTDDQLNAISGFANVPFSRKQMSQLIFWGPLQLTKYILEKSENSLEVINIPNSLPVAEYSMRVPIGEATDKFIKVTKILKSNNIKLCTDQSGRTSRILNYLKSRNLNKIH